MATLPIPIWCWAKTGIFYGTTSGDATGGYGTVFQVTTDGALNTFYSFTGLPDGYAPYAGLTLGADGNFYGTTGYGGTNDLGTVFRMTTTGLTILHSFAGGDDGDTPYAGLTLGSDGSLYGTTTGYGGSGYGTIFRVTTNGGFTTLHVFNAGKDGDAPVAGLTLGGDGNLYGTTSGYSGTGYGTVFQLTTNGVLNTLVSFNGTNGANPEAGLVLGVDGKLYSATAHGGPGGGGTIFRLEIPKPISKFTGVPNFRRAASS